MAPKVTLRASLKEAVLISDRLYGDQLYALEIGDFADEAHKQYRFEVLGRVTAVCAHCQVLLPSVERLRSLCSASKPTPSTYRHVLQVLGNGGADIPIIIREFFRDLPDLAADLAEYRANTSLTTDETVKRAPFTHRLLRHFNDEEKAGQVAAARAKALVVADKLAALPERLDKARELAESGGDLKQIKALLS